MEYKDLPFGYVPNTFNRNSNAIYAINAQDKIKDQVILSVEPDSSTYYTKPIVLINPYKVSIGKKLILPFYMDIENGAAKLTLSDDGIFNISNVYVYDSDGRLVRQLN